MPRLPPSTFARPRGFTLIEIGVVLLVVVGLMAVAIPTLQSVSGARARAEISKLSANIRATRGHAAVSGETCRMVFCIQNCAAGGKSGKGGELGDSSYFVECTKGAAPIAKESVRNGAMDEEEVDLQHLTEKEKAKYEIMKRAQFAPAATLPVQQLSGVRLGSVWTAHQSEKYSKGKAYLYFYPSGLGERASIQLQDGEDWYSIQVSPLSGKVAVVEGREDLSEQREEED